MNAVGIVGTVSGGVLCAPQKPFAADCKSRGVASPGTVQGPEAGATAPAPALPCLYKNNCTEVMELSPYRKRQAESLASNIRAMVQRHGLERIGFLTLTFPEHVTDIRDAQRRWHSFRTHVIRRRYGEAVKVFERCKNGRIHYHLVMVLSQDIRSGFNFEEVKRGNYRSVSPFLRREWAYLRETLPRYGFGRHELLPVRSNGDGVARYVAKYLTKSKVHPLYADRGIRRVEYIQGARWNTAQFSWIGPHNWVYRKKLAVWASARGMGAYDRLGAVCGPRWFWRHKEEIMATVLPPDTVYPTVTHVEAAGLDAYLPEGVGPESVRNLSGMKPEVCKRDLVNELLVEYAKIPDRIQAAEMRAKVLGLWNQRNWRSWVPVRSAPENAGLDRKT